MNDLSTNLPNEKKREINKKIDIFFNNIINIIIIFVDYKPIKIDITRTAFILLSNNQFKTFFTFRLNDMIFLSDINIIPNKITKW